MANARREGLMEKKNDKNNSRYTKIIPAQQEIITLHKKNIHGSLINHTYIKIIPDIDDINSRQAKKIILFQVQIKCVILTRTGLHI